MTQSNPAMSPTYDEVEVKIGELRAALRESIAERERKVAEISAEHDQREAALWRELAKCHAQAAATLGNGRRKGT